MWSIGVEVEQETRPPPPKKNPGSAAQVNFANYLPKPSTDQFARVNDKQPAFCSPPLVSVDLV